MYDSFATTFSQSRKNLHWEEIDYFLANTTNPGNVLDIGCGNGRLLGEIIKQNKEIKSYLGIDSSEKLLTEAKKIFPHSQNSLPLNSNSQTPNSFLLLDMRKLETLPKIIHEPTIREQTIRELSLQTDEIFDSIFFIASFHHLETLEERIQTLSVAKNLLKKGGKIYMTNWALESDINREKYASSKIPRRDNSRMVSEKSFASSDFQIKIGAFHRYYHSFTLEELEYIAKKAGFQIIENRLFDTQKNFITILEK